MNSLTYDNTSNLKEVTIEISATFPMPRPYSNIKVLIAETRTLRKEESEQNFYKDFEQKISENFTSLVESQIKNFYESEKKVK
jgi:hypothetical protein